MLKFFNILKFIFKEKTAYDKTSWSICEIRWFAVGKLKKNQIGKNDFIKLVNQNKDKTYNESNIVLSIDEIKQAISCLKVSRKIVSVMIIGAFVYIG